MSNSVLKAISERRSIRGYTDQPVSEAHLDAIMKAALESPSARNSQPWHFSVVKNLELIKDINDAVSRQLGQDGDIFYAAPTVIFLSADPKGSYSRMDCGIAVENMSLAAHSLGLGSVILGMPAQAFLSDKADEFRKKLKFPAGYDFMIALAVGHPAVSKEAHPINPGKIDYIS